MSDAIKPVAEIVCGRLRWAIPEDDYVLPTRFLNNETHALYDQATLDAAIAAERERMKALAHSRAGYEAASAAHHAGKCHPAFEMHMTRNAAMCDLIDVLFGPSMELTVAKQQPVDNLQQQ